MGEKPKSFRELGKQVHNKSKKGQDPLEAATAFFKHKLHIKAIGEHAASPAMKLLYEPYKSMTGYELPYICSENQCGHIMSDAHDMEMYNLNLEIMNAIKEVTDKRQAEIEERAKALAGDCEHEKIFLERGLAQVLKKWLLKRGGENEKGLTKAQIRLLHKKESERLGYWIADNWKNGAPLRVFYDEAKSLGLNRHDCTDAKLIAMQGALSLYERFAQNVLGRRKPHEQRSDTPVLTGEQMNNGGTLRVLGIDPGTSNLGVCLLELVGMVQPPPDKLALTAGLDNLPADSTLPEPVFRILFMDLINLNKPWSETLGYSALHYQPLVMPGAVMEPDYTTIRPLTSYFPLLNTPYQQTVRKRKADTEADNEKPAKRPRVSKPKQQTLKRKADTQADDEKPAKRPRVTKLKQQTLKRKVADDVGKGKRTKRPRVDKPNDKPICIDLVLEDEADDKTEDRMK
jgi:hypothetical protein